MNGWQRIQAVASGQLPDRIPVFCNLFEQGATELGLSIREYYSKPENVAEGQLRLRRKYDYDNLWGAFYVGKEAEMFGCRRMIFADNGPPNVGQLVLQTSRISNGWKSRRMSSRIPDSPTPGAAWKFSAVNRLGNTRCLRLSLPPLPCPPC